MNSLVSRIQDSASRLISHPAFRAWADKIQWEPGDLLLINNSFVFRDVKTTKSQLYLAFTVSSSGMFEDLKIAKPGSFNSDFKRITKHRASSVVLSSLPETVAQHHAKLGNLIYLLVGEVDDSISQSVPLDVDPFQSVKWDPLSTSNCLVQNGTIVIRETFDEEDLWQVLLPRIPEQTDRDELKQKFGAALDKLQDSAIAQLKLPQTGHEIGDGVTTAICRILEQERDAYKLAIADMSDPSSLNEVLRIAYNFAGDATNYIRLIVSICDLKPLILWGTIAEHFVLSNQFRQLPWTRRNRKPSLKNYESTIKDARNSAFHNLFPFRKSLSVHLPSDALEDAELRIFSEHSKKKDNTLNYMDKPMVDVLVGFTRAREVRVAERFWHKNVEVMNSTISLFKATDTLLRMTHSSQL